MKKRVTVQSSAGAIPDSEGIVVQTWTDAATLEGILLPYGSEMAAKEYGLTETVRYRFLYRGSHAALVIGNQIVYQSISYPIVHVADFSKATDVILGDPQ